MNDYTDFINLFDCIFTHECQEDACFKDGVFTLNMAGTEKKDIKVQVKGNILMVNDRKFRIGQNDLKVGEITYKNGLLKVPVIEQKWSDVEIN